MDKLKSWCRGKLTKENMIVLALLGVLIMVIALPVEKKEENLSAESVLTDRTADKMDTEIQTATGLAEAEMEARLEAFLSCMEGVGKVKVLVTYASSDEQVVEKDVPQSVSQTSENDASGGSREILQQDSSEETVYTTDGLGNQVPYVKKTLAARVEGVTVLAQGGGSAVVQKEITEVMEALFGIEPHKIKVAKMGSVSAQSTSRENE